MISTFSEPKLDRMKVSRLSILLFFVFQISLYIFQPIIFQNFGILSRCPSYTFSLYM